ncbi:ATP-grasp domain-containing protein [Streptomyces sp. NPDC048290]|uniref:carboxylate--amine ligase n=1 Tax=Streptomyces sp. NPDC048290 TaxID=3155811 RepID=UPI0034256F9D
MSAPPLDTRVPAVLLRIDRNPFHHGTLGAVRSLGRAGVETHVVADGTASPVAASRYLTAVHEPPAPGAPDEEIARVLAEVAARIARPAVLVPLDDASALATARLRTRLAPAFRLPALPGPLAERVADKAELAALCTGLNIPHPTTLVPGSAAEAGRAAWRLGLPVVAKWSRPWLLPAGSGLRSTTVVRSAQQARELYGRGAEAGSPLLLQEFLPPGPGLDWFCHGHTTRDGTRHGGGTGRKLLSWPRGAGLTAVGEWAPNPALDELTGRLVEALGYRGVLDLDFRRHDRTGAYHLLDFNPRPGAQFRLFADGAGLDVVRALHLDLTDRPLPPPRPRPGRRFLVENYAPLTALRPSRTSRELAWYAADDRAPARALWLQWPRRLTRRLRPAAPVPADPDGPRPHIIRQPSPPTDERASRP